MVAVVSFLGTRLWLLLQLHKMTCLKLHGCCCKAATHLSIVVTTTGPSCSMTCLKLQLNVQSVVVFEGTKVGVVDKTSDPQTVQVATVDFTSL